MRHPTRSPRGPRNQDPLLLLLWLLLPRTYEGRVLFLPSSDELGSELRWKLLLKSKQPPPSAICTATPLKNPLPLLLPEAARPRHPNLPPPGMDMYPPRLLRPPAKAMYPRFGHESSNAGDANCKTVTSKRSSRTRISSSNNKNNNRIIGAMLFHRQEPQLQ